MPIERRSCVFSYPASPSHCPSAPASLSLFASMDLVRYRERLDSLTCLGSLKVQAHDDIASSLGYVLVMLQARGFLV
jgi:hypothetical protein